MKTKFSFSPMLFFLLVCLDIQTATAQIMKKLTACITTLFLLLKFIPTQLKAGTKTIGQTFRTAAVLALLLINAIFGDAQITQDWAVQHSGMRGVAVVTDANGNIYVTGPSLQDAGHNYREDIVTIKYDMAGSAIWVREFDEKDDATNGSDIPFSMTLDPAGNILIAGRSFLASTADNFLTLKYDPNGNLLWKARNTAGFEPARIATDAAANVYVTGVSSSSNSAKNYVTVKYNLNGTLVWARTYNGPNNFSDQPYGLAVTAAGDVAVTGASTGGVTSFDIATILYDANGNERWVRRYNDAANGGDRGNDVAFGPGGEVYVGGSDNTDFVLIKYDAAGNQLWVRTYNGPSNKADGIRRIRVDSQGNIIVTGSEQQDNFYSDFATIKYDPAGNQLWVQRLNLTTNGDEIPYYMVLGADNAVYVTGESANRIVTAKYAANGTPQWSMIFDNPNTLFDRSYGIALDAANNVVVTGQEPMLTIHYLQSSLPCNVIADFSSSPTSGCMPQTVNFKNLSTGPVTSWSWNFGDGSTSTAQNPSHIYNTVGTYTVNLTVNSAICNNIKTKIGYITIGTAPMASLFGSPTSGNTPLTVNFIDQSIGAPTTWAWNFGDGSTSTAQNPPSHQYTTAGTYSVSLTAKNACGSNTFTKSNYITVNAACSNIARGKTATASGSSGSNTANLAVDGNASTFWRSSSGGTQYLQVDFGAGTLKYSQATIKWRGIRFAKSFQIRVSNNANFSTFTTVFSTTAGSGGNRTIALSGAPRTERYIRLNMTQVNSGYYALNEFEVCGFLSSALSKPATIQREVPGLLIQSSDINIFPNPVRDELRITINRVTEPVVIDVFDINGRKMLSTQATQSTKIDVGKLASGIYFVKVATKQGMLLYQEKIMKE